ncbi:MAG: DNRLRE domain-containing protein [Dehalococcoidia bacterium]|nr:MAG: DNRLRE domain-containing protein [Dehalococcoidia bacterium]
MKLQHIRTILSLLFIFCMIAPLSIVTPALAAPPPTPPEYDVTIKSEAAVFIDETLPTTNFNVGSEGTFLRVGYVPEFCGDWWTLIRFDDIIESDGGPLPDDATIQDAKIKIYKDSGISGTIYVYLLRGHFNESTVSWNTKPPVMGGGTPQVIASQYISGASGWYYIDIPNSVIYEWISPPTANYGVVLAPSWSGCGDSLAFRSDEVLSMEPILEGTYQG